MTTSNAKAKSILRTRPSATYKRKSAKFDELNILQTLHTLEKEFQSSRFEEPKTPFVFKLINEQVGDQFDAEVLTNKLRLVANTQTPSFGDDGLSDDEFPETDEEKIHRIVFERRRKAHYNEYSAVELARKLIEEDFANLEESGNEEITETVTSVKCSSSASTEEASSDEDEQPSSDGQTASALGLNKPIFIEKIQKPKDVEDTLDSSHPCYGKIKKRTPQQQQQQDQEQEREREEE